MQHRAVRPTELPDDRPGMYPTAGLAIRGIGLMVTLGLLSWSVIGLVVWLLWRLISGAVG